MENDRDELQEESLAFADINLAGSRQERVYAMTGPNDPDGFVSLPLTHEGLVSDSLERDDEARLHAVTKLLEYISARVGANARGRIVVFSNSPACPSCRTVITKFRVRHQSVTLDVYSGRAKGGILRQVLGDVKGAVGGWVHNLWRR